MIYLSPEPTKKCTQCGGVFEYKFLVAGRTYEGGVRPLCKPCRQVQQARERARKALRVREIVKLEIETRRARVDLALPRTFSHIKDAPWDGRLEPMYVRNAGNKHIPSRGFV